ncbi:MAG: BON domain-containing protein [Gammaproteobacteria bacterium]|nr:BON domain-containing protein [Gammaproteobacteria bacterium]
MKWLMVAALGLAVVGCDVPPLPRSQPKANGALKTCYQPPISPTPQPLTALVISYISRDPMTCHQDIRATLMTGRLRLSGVVDSAAAKLRAAELARDIANIAIDNHLIVRDSDITDSPLAGVEVYL